MDSSSSSSTLSAERNATSSTGRSSEIECPPINRAGIGSVSKLSLFFSSFFFPSLFFFVFGQAKQAPNLNSFMLTIHQFFMLHAPQNLTNGGLALSILTLAPFKRAERLKRCKTPPMPPLALRMLKPKWRSQLLINLSIIPSISTATETTWLKIDTAKHSIIRSIQAITLHLSRETCLGITIHRTPYSLNWTDFWITESTMMACASLKAHWTCPLKTVRLSKLVLSLYRIHTFLQSSNISHMKSILGSKCHASPPQFRLCHPRVLFCTLKIIILPYPVLLHSLFRCQLLRIRFKASH